MRTRSADIVFGSPVRGGRGEPAVRLSPTHCRRTGEGRSFTFAFHFGERSSCWAAPGDSAQARS